MKEFKDYVDIILLHEGGYVNDLVDPGGETNYGISKRQYPTLNIKELTKEKASEIYYKDYWIPMNLDLLNNELLKLHLFDMGVNTGIKTAIKLLQQLTDTSTDGVLGKITANAANNFNGDIVALYKDKRYDYYGRLVKKNPKLIKFLNGWINRVNYTRFK